MMARFETLPTVAYLGPEHRYPWQLQDDLVYRSDIIGTVTVPAGYCTDFASVPRLPIVYWWTGGRATLPAIIHDLLYDARPEGVTRRQADRVFLEAMAASRDPKRWITRRAMYLGVRAGGRRPWRTDSSHKLSGLSAGPYVAT